MSGIKDRFLGMIVLVIIYYGLYLGITGELCPRRSYPRPGFEHYSIGTNSGYPDKGSWETITGQTI